MKQFTCRLCKSSLVLPVIKFPATPLANEFVSQPQDQDLFTLEVAFCNRCYHYQLNETIDPERLFRNYLFVAGTSPLNVEHFRKYAEDMINRFNIQPNSLVLDIASNDGTLLRHFKDMGMRVLGIDPAMNLAEEATKNGIETIPEFFNEKMADKIVAQYGSFDLVTANNVFAHVPNLIDFAKGVQKLLSPNGVFSFEVSYFGDVCDKALFDTIYHEHSSYHHLGPLVSFFMKHGLELFDVERIPTHGGSVRVFVRRTLPMSMSFPRVGDYDRGRLNRILYEEMNIHDRAHKLQQKITDLGKQLNIQLKKLKSQKKTIAIYGVPAKATTLMYAFDIDPAMIDFAVDDAPLKQGMFTPGKHVPVLSPEEIYERKPDVLLILAWNFAESIKEKVRATWYEKLKHVHYPIFITPLPELTVDKYCSGKTCTCGVGPWRHVSTDAWWHAEYEIEKYICEECGGADHDFHPKKDR